MRPPDRSPVDTVVVITGAGVLAGEAVAAIPGDAIVIAADGAVDFALAAGVHPAGVVGDLDSISADGLEWAEQHATITRHSPDKNETDTELALAMANRLVPARLILIGNGDRLDHTLAAIGALGHPRLTSIPVIEGWWGEQRLRVVHGPGRAAITVEPGTTLSLLALHGPCSGVTIDGVRWPLHGADLHAVVGLGVSNVAETDRVDVSVSAGVLTIILNQLAEPLGIQTEPTS
jgi:thiamine pyrophosphokinase